jgi:hypothetical protein
MLHALRPLWGDDERYAVASRESSPRMDDLLRADLGRMGADEEAENSGWDTAGVEPRADVATTHPSAHSRAGGNPD